MAKKKKKREKGTRHRPSWHPEHQDFCPKCGFDLTKPIGSLPYEAELSENAKAIGLLTYRHKEGLWWSSFAANFAEIQKMKDIKELHDREGEAAIVVGAGPTVEKYGQIEKLKRFDGALFSTDKMLIPLLREGVVPEFVCTIDGDPSTKKFYDDPLVDEHKDDVTALIDVFTIHPQTLQRIPFQKAGFLVFQDDIMREQVSITRALRIMTQKTITQVGGNVGSANWFLSYFLNFTDIGLVGLDFGYPPGTPPEETAYFDAWSKIIKVKKERGEPVPGMGQFFRMVRNPDTGATVLVDLVWDTYAHTLKQFTKKAKERNDRWEKQRKKQKKQEKKGDYPKPNRTYNLSPASALYGEGIITMDLDQFISRCKDGRYEA